jgi:hypothetical protein
VYVAPLSLAGSETLHNSKPYTITVIGGRHSTISSARIAGDEKSQRQDVTPEAYWPASHL